MAGKRGLGRMGFGSVTFVGILALHGCIMAPPCGCSEAWEEVVMHVRDEIGPVDSARISVYRTDDGSPIDTALFEGGYAGQRGTHMVFNTRYNHEFGPGATTLAIRVVASKGGKTGEEMVTLSVNADHYGLRKVSGPDTLTIR